MTKGCETEAVDEPYNEIISVGAYVSFFVRSRICSLPASTQDFVPQSALFPCSPVSIPVIVNSFSETPVKYLPRVYIFRRRMRGSLIDRLLTVLVSQFSVLSRLSSCWVRPSIWTSARLSVRSFVQPSDQRSVCPSDGQFVRPPIRQFIRSSPGRQCVRTADHSTVHPKVRKSETVIESQKMSLKWTYWKWKLWKQKTVKTKLLKMNIKTKIKTNRWKNK